MSEEKKSSGMAAVIAVYLVAIGVFIAVYVVSDAGSVLRRTFVADIGATLVVFLASVFANNSSVYDPYWSVLPPVMFVTWLIDLGQVTLFALIILAVTLIWGTRLTLNWATSWSGMGQEDWRYRSFRARFGRLYWPVSLLAIHLFPTVSVFLGCIPVYFVLTEGIVSVPIAGLATLVTAVAVYIEATADIQLRRFKAEGGEGPCTVGLWRFSRHPNYLGELGFWLGLLLFGLAAGAPWWSLAGMAVMVGIFAGYSIPAMERKITATRPSYRIIQEAVPVLVPIPGRYLLPEDERVV